MRILSPFVALLVGTLSVYPYLFRPASAPVSTAARHDCCCARCPGPGLCPCDKGSAGEGACVKAADERPTSVQPPPSVPSVKLISELPFRPVPTESGGRRDEPRSSPRLSVTAHPPEKVPISVP